VLTFAPSLYDTYRMNKQPISVTLSPDNLLWLHGRARAVAAASLSEFLDRLITRARCGQDTPKPYRSMRGTLALLDAGSHIDTLLAASDFEEVSRKKWGKRLAEFEGQSLVKPLAPARRRSSRHPAVVAERAPAYGRRSGRG